MAATAARREGRGNVADVPPVVEGPTKGRARDVARARGSRSGESATTGEGAGRVAGGRAGDARERRSTPPPSASRPREARRKWTGDRPVGHGGGAAAMAACGSAQRREAQGRPGGGGGRRKEGPQRRTAKRERRGKGGSDGGGGGRGSPHGGAAEAGEEGERTRMSWLAGGFVSPLPGQFGPMQKGMLPGLVVAHGGPRGSSLGEDRSCLGSACGSRTSR